MKEAVKPGIYVGVINIVLGLLVYIVDPAIFVKWWYGLLMILVNIGLVIYFSIQYRKDSGGYLSFKNAYLHGLGTFIIAGALGTLFNLILFTVIDPDLSATLTEATIEQTADMMRGFGAPDEAIDETVEKLRVDMPERFSLVGTLKTFGWSLLVYAVLALITGAIAKRKEPEFE